MDLVIEYFFVYMFGAVVYGSMEMLFRGFTHWTMFIAGGLCFTILYHIFNKKRGYSLGINCLIGTAVITGVELVFGCVFNLGLGWNIWDYSHYPMDFLGQICLSFTLLWFLLSAPILWIAKGLKKKITGMYLRSENSLL